MPSAEKVIIVGDNGIVLEVTASGAIPIVETPAATGTQTGPALTGASQTILAANANRLGGTVYNDSVNTLKLLLTTGGTASATAFSYNLQPTATFEIPFGYTGAIIGFASAASGNARVTEYSA